MTQTTFSSSKSSSTISINFIVPQSWPDMSDKQLRYLEWPLLDGEHSLHSNATSRLRGGKVITLAL